jgi:hypothetical protein
MLTFDKNSTDLSYNLTLDYYALDYWGLIKYFVFRREVFWILFAAIGVFSVVLAAIYWVITILPYTPRLIAMLRSAVRTSCASSQVL